MHPILCRPICTTWPSTTMRMVPPCNLNSRHRVRHEDSCIPVQLQQHLPTAPSCFRYLQRCCVRMATPNEKWGLPDEKYPSNHLFLFILVKIDVRRGSASCQVQSQPRCSCRHQWLPCVLAHSMDIWFTLDKTTDVHNPHKDLNPANPWSVMIFSQPSLRLQACTYLRNRRTCCHRDFPHFQILRLWQPRANYAGCLLCLSRGRVPPLSPVAITAQVSQLQTQVVLQPPTRHLHLQAGEEPLSPWEAIVLSNPSNFQCRPITITCNWPASLL